MQEQVLPRYSTISIAPPRYIAPSSLSSTAQGHYSFPLLNSKGKTWASVNLRKDIHRRAPSGANDVPIIEEGANPMTGTVNLELQSPETIQGITLVVSPISTLIVVCPTTQEKLGSRSCCDRRERRRISDLLRS